jgi:DNA-binding PadR family transcriptional regulator
LSRSDPQDLLPLTEPVYYILLALADADRHGYAILQEVEDRTDGAVRLRTGTLYTAIRRLLEQGLIVETDERPADDDERRRYYRLTEFGRAVARAEAERLEGLVGLARDKAVLGAGRPT